jgi:exonuclease III
VRIVAWNIRAGGGRRALDIAAQLERWQADVVALSEFRATPPSAQLAQALAAVGLAHQATADSPRAPAANRVFIAARWPLARVRLARAPERSGRWLAARVDAPVPLTLVAVHVPNRDSGKKWLFHGAALRMARQWADGPALMAGDTNSGCIGVDEECAGAGFIEREDTWMRCLDAAGWRDAFRHLHGGARSWTWHSPNAGTGYRLDQAFVNDALLNRLRAAQHAWGSTHATGPRTRRDELSDHAALIVDFDLSLS